MASSLPRPRTALFGRRRSLAEVCSRLERHRLVTLTGIGGVGKTRLALRVAEQCVPEIADDLGWVDLAPLGDSGLVVPTVCSSLEVRTTADVPPAEALVNRLRVSRWLVVLDNCEHVAGACGDLASTLLERCPGLRILATSREALGIEGEAMWPVPPLWICGHRVQRDNPVEGARQSAAVQLFVDRAQAAHPGFELTSANVAAVVRVCERLEGIPLALELAAARVAVLTAEQIADRLDRGLELLRQARRETPPRHHTMQAALEWSHDLLTEPERVLFRRFAVFRGHTDIDACESACSGAPLDRTAILDILTSLINKSLVAVGERGGSAGYRLLEPVRQFAAGKLEASGELDRVRRRHAGYFLDHARTLAPGLRGPDRPRALDALESAHDNLRVAWDYAVSAGDAATVAGLARALFWFWHFAGHISEGRERSEEALQRLGASVPARADLLYVAGALAWMQGDYQLAGERLLACADRCQKADRGDLYPVAMRELAGVHLTTRDLEAAEELYEKSIVQLRKSESTWDLALALVMLADVRDALGDAAAAREAREEARVLFGKSRDPWGLALARFGLALGAAREDDWEAAGVHAREALAAQGSTGDPWSIGQALALLGEIELNAGRAERAAGFLRDSVQAFSEVGDRTSLVYLLLSFAELERRRGRILRAVRLAGAGQAQGERLEGSYPYALSNAKKRAQTVSALRRKAGEAAFAEEWAAGRSLGLDEAVALALDSGGPEGRAEPVPDAGRDAALCVLALGPAAVYRNRRRLQAADWTYALPKELLFYLLVHGPRTKEQIGLDFWPEASTDELKGRFRTALYQLRRALGGTEWVLYRDRRYAFNRELDYWFDLEAFESGVERGGALLGSDASGAAAELQRAVDLYRGDFLEGERTAEWASDSRERLRRQCYEALLTLGGLRAAEGAHDTAAAAYRRAVALDDLDERAHLQLARELASGGDRAAALRHLDELSELVRRELDAEPSEAARELRFRLQQDLEA